jgi:hypothetical protein
MTDPGHNPTGPAPLPFDPAAHAAASAALASEVEAYRAAAESVDWWLSLAALGLPPGPAEAWGAIAALARSQNRLARMMELNQQSVANLTALLEQQIRLAEAMGAVQQELARRVVELEEAGDGPEFDTGPATAGYGD